jgi:hypothetical protein
MTLKERLWLKSQRLKNALEARETAFPGNQHSDLPDDREAALLNKNLFHDESGRN